MAAGADVGGARGRDGGRQGPPRTESSVGGLAGGAEGCEHSGCSQERGPGGQVGPGA